MNIITFACEQHQVVTVVDLRCRVESEGLDAVLIASTWEKAEEWIKSDAAKTYIHRQDQWWALQNMIVDLDPSVVWGNDEAKKYDFRVHFYDTNGVEISGANGKLSLGLSK